MEKRTVRKLTQWVEWSEIDCRSRRGSLRRALFGIFAALLLVACGTPQLASGRAFHSFQFDPSRESSNTETLYYQYGDSREHGLRTDLEDAAKGKSRQGINTSGDLPVGDFFYVKWRNTLSGQIHEDRLDLRPLLPSSMYRWRLHPIIEGAQLYLYLVSFDPVRPYFTEEQVEAIRRTHQTLIEKVFSFSLRNRVIQIYPERQVDPHLPPDLRN